MKFSDHLINNIKNEIDELEIELNYYHNTESLSPKIKIKKVKDILEKILKNKNILELYLSYILESKEKENDRNN